MALQRNNFNNKNVLWNFFVDFIWGSKLEIPTDIYRVIIPFFTVKELKKNSRVNKKWKELCQLSLNLYKEENYYLIGKYIIITKSYRGVPIRIKREDISNDEVIDSYTKYEEAKFFKNEKDAVDEKEIREFRHWPNAPRDRMPNECIRFATFKVSLFSKKEKKEEQLEEKSILYPVNDSVIPIKATFYPSTLKNLPTNPSPIEIDFKNYTKNYNSFWNKATNIVSEVSNLLLPKLTR